MLEERLCFVKINVNPNSEFNEIEVIINCPQDDSTVQRIVTTLRTVDKRLKGYFQNENYNVDINEVLYIDSVDRKVFFYTENRVYETRKKLYELEDYLRNSSFFRVSKSTIINLNRVRSLRPELGARLLMTMENGEKVLVSRQYAQSIKSALEVD